MDDSELMSIAGHIPHNGVPKTASWKLQKQNAWSWGYCSEVKFLPCKDEAIETQKGKRGQGFLDIAHSLIRKR